MMKKLLLVVLMLVLVMCAGMLTACNSNPAEDVANPVDDRPLWVNQLVKGDGKTVTIGADTAYPPFEFAKEDGSGFQGFDVDLMNAIGEKLNVEFEFKTYDFSAIIGGLAAGTEFDMITSALTIKPERATSVDFGLPYYADSLGLAVPNNSTITSLDDIVAGTRVAVQNGSSAQTWADKNLPEGVKYVLNPDTATLFQSMKAGDADALIQDFSNASAFITDPVFDAKIVQDISTNQYFGMAFQQNELGAAMKKDIDLALLEVVEDGTYAEIFEKWFGITPSFLPGEVTVQEALDAFKP